MTILTLHNDEKSETFVEKVWVEYFKLFWYYSNAFKSAKIHIEYLVYV